MLLSKNFDSNFQYVYPTSASPNNYWAQKSTFITVEISLTLEYLDF